MNVVAAEPRTTPDDLLAMPDEKDYELVDGLLVERKMSVLSSWVGSRLYRYLDVFADEGDLGWAWADGMGIRCFPEDPLKVRKPDAAFVRRGRLPAGLPPEGYLPIAPDLAIEVISPHDLAADLEDKVGDYLRAGVTLIWVVNPESRTARVHRADGSGSWLNENDELSGEDVLPGFRLRLGAIFPPVETKQP